MTAEAIHKTICSAFAALAPIHQDVVRSLLNAPANSASAAELRDLLGLNHHVTVNQAMGAFGLAVWNLLGEHPDGCAPGTQEDWTVIATGSPVTRRGFVWTLRPAVVAALLNNGNELKDRLPNEVSDAGQFFEGAVRSVAVKAWERNAGARQRCIELHGCRCRVCDMDFGERYGPLAAGLIHVHHLVPLRTVGATYEVNPESDLCPVCPNCHAVLHLTDPPLSIEEVKTMLKTSR